MTNLRLAMLTTLIIMGMALFNNANAGTITDEAFNIYVNTYNIYANGTDPNTVGQEMVNYLDNFSKRHLAYVYEIADARAKNTSLNDHTVAPIIAHFAELVYNSRR